jgi:hypothetical protein
MRKRKRALLSILVEDDGPFDGPIYCPRCKGHGCRPVSVRVMPGGDVGGTVTIRADGISVDKTKKRLGVEARIAVTFDCPKGHVWELEFLYCRGETLGGLSCPSMPKHGELPVIGRDGDHNSPRAA